MQVMGTSGAVGLEDGLGRLPDCGKEADFRTSRVVDDAVKKGEKKRLAQRKARQEKAAAAFAAAHEEFQRSATASMAGCT